jgi:hypothetical protein
MTVVPFAAQVGALDTAGVSITSVTGTDITSAGIKVHPYETFALWLDISVAGGTSPTLDIDFEWSEDSTDGVDGTWATMQHFSGASSTTQDVSMNQIAATTGAYASVHWPCPTSQSGYVRAAFVSGGTSPEYTIDSIYWIKRNAAHA